MKNQLYRSIKITALACTAAAALPALGHAGRNFTVEIVDDGNGGEQLRAQGFNSLFENEPGTSTEVRPYYGAIHDHFENANTPSGGAEADQPGFFIAGDVQDRLDSSTLRWRLVNAFKWEVDRDTILKSETMPILNTGIDEDSIAFVALSASETISINSTRGGGAVLSTNIGGSFTLTDSVNNGSLADDVEVTYDIGIQPDSTIYVLEAVLESSVAGIGDSESFYTVLSPDGANGYERLHFPSLLVESSLGTQVPEPGSLALVAVLPLLMRRRRRA